MMRPSVSRPTGTAIGAPVFTTACPRVSPSRGLHSNATHSLVPDVLRDLENQTHVVVLHLEGGHDGRQVAVKVHVDDGTDDLRAEGGRGIQ